MKIDNIISLRIVIYLSLLLVTSCTNQEAYSDGKWWAEECCKMLENEKYDSPVTKQYMRMKFHTDNCESDFYAGFKDYSAKDSIHQESLINELKLMIENCEGEKKDKNNTAKKLNIIP